MWVFVLLLIHEQVCKDMSVCSHMRLYTWINSLCMKQFCLLEHMGASSLNTEILLYVAQGYALATVLITDNPPLSPTAYAVSSFPPHAEGSAERRCGAVCLNVWEPRA